jgi:hypothetical protein
LPEEPQAHNSANVSSSIGIAIERFNITALAQVTERSCARTLA